MFKYEVNHIIRIILIFQKKMNFNYQKARELMVENQLRPNKINDLNILNLFNRIPKEKFLPSSITKISYSDADIKMLSNRGYLKN